uniref:HTH CENPB-type domain-containing protein n=1 Tax=Globodera rostochiensis TaxID=31243 RepID=A0A914HX95_GLORO
MMEEIGNSSENAKVCVSCHNPSSGAHFCKKCFEPCHAIPPCSISIDGEEGYGAKVVCYSTIVRDKPTTSASSASIDYEPFTSEDEDDSTNPPNKQKRRTHRFTPRANILQLIGILKESATRKRIQGGGRKLTDADFDTGLADWVKELRGRKLRVSRNMIVTEAQKMSLHYSKMKNCSASNGWLDYFMKRHNFTLRKPTSVAQKPPDAYVDAIINFILYVQKLWKTNDYKFVYACDETAVWLDPSGGSCVSEKGAKSVTVLNTGHEKARVTVILTARTDGVKLPPFVLLPKKRIAPEIVKRFKNKLVFGNFFFGNRLLIWDSFRCHISADTKQTLKRLAIHRQSYQVPDVSWNAPFKNSIRKFHSDWMLHGDKPTTSGGNLKAPPMEIYLEWIVSAWEALSKDVIVKSFLCCGITKEDDGKNDALIHVFKKDGAIPNGLALLQQRRQKEDMIKLVEEIDLNEDDNLGSDYSIKL